MLKVAEVSGSILSLGNADNDIITARDFTTNISGANTINKKEANDFKIMSNSLVKTLNEKGADYSKEQLQAQQTEFKNVVDTLLKTTAATGVDKANLNASLLESQAKVMAKLESLLKALGEN